MQEQDLLEIGKNIKKTRIEGNLTQAQLAQNANVSLSTVVRLEAGHSVQLDSFIRILRVLKLLARLQYLFPEETVHPMELLQSATKERKRVHQKSQTPTPQNNAWKWGDEK